MTDGRELPHYRHPHGAGDDRHVRGERAFLEHNGFQAATVIFEQFSGTEVARDQHRVPGKAGLGGGAHPPRDDPHQPVGQILEVVHPLL